MRTTFGEEGELGSCAGCDISAVGLWLSPLSVLEIRSAIELALQAGGPVSGALGRGQRPEVRVVGVEPAPDIGGVRGVLQVDERRGVGVGDLLGRLGGAVVALTLMRFVSVEALTLTAASTLACVHPSPRRCAVRAATTGSPTSLACVAACRVRSTEPEFCRAG